MNKVLLTTFLVLLAGAATVTAAGDPAEGKAKSMACAGCHGVDGNSFAPMWPKLAGQHPQYLLKQLGDFKAGSARSNAVMAPIATDTAQEDLQDIVAYFSAQQATPGIAESDDAVLLAQGKRIYRGGNADTGVPACMSCHGPSGKGNSLAGFPALYNQNATYTSNQLKAFKAGDRKNDAKEMMRILAKHMTAEEIRAVSQYIAVGLR